MGGTFEKMKAAGLADDEGELTTPPEGDETELVLESADPEPETVVVEEKGEQDPEPGAQPEHGQRIEVPKATLAELRRTRREAREQVTAKDVELQQLRSKLDEVTRMAVQKPKYTDFRTDEEYENALFEWQRVTGGAQPSTPTPTQAPARGAPQPMDFSEAVNAHYDRAEKLGVDLDKFQQAERAARTALGEGVTDAIISAVGDGSEKAIYLLGSNPAEMSNVQTMLQRDPSGLQAIAHLSKLAARATVRRKTQSGAPRPTRQPASGHVTPNAGPLTKALEKAEKSGNTQEAFRIRRQARKEGVTL